jgi:dihydroorotase
MSNPNSNTAPIYDLILHGGKLIDPSLGIIGYHDIGIRDGQIAAIAQVIPNEQSKETVNISGKIVTPGLVDIHTHFYWGVFSHSIQGDATFLPQGVTTAVDGGSSGHVNFPGLKEYVIYPSKTRMYAFIHLSAIGLTSQAACGELYDLRFAQIDEAVACVKNNPDLVLGIKVRITHNGTGVENALPALRLARQAADDAETRLMVHVSDSPIPIPTILEYMHPGDIATHIFAGLSRTVLDRERNVLPEVRMAQERGVILDIGRGASALDYGVAQAALDQGIKPNTISTDAHTPQRIGNISHPLPSVMSEFLAMGMSLEDVIRCTTSAAAQAIGKDKLTGTLAIGYPADIAVFELRQKKLTFSDGVGNKIEGRDQLVPIMTIRNGHLMFTS